MKSAAFYLLACVATSAAAADYPAGVDADDPLLRSGCLDVTKAPYLADATGANDSTRAIQQAVDDARDHGLVCFFPEGTYLISDTLSCEQQVRKLDRPRFTDGKTQHYWDLPHRIAMLGSTKGKRPVLRLSGDAKGFDDPARPKIAVWIWAQTRDDAPGKEEPEWGKEQPNISFNHLFRGIDIDIRGHAGAVGIRHSGSQGSTMQDVTVYAQGAYAGLDCCPGQ
ncbi:MAG: glycoside hydrolase family 55 protein, partial [Planctomycetes bacterium]|nr:glycoside hydrolase family 55 protein [Planctomycetota bacterium]